MKRLVLHKVTLDYAHSRPANTNGIIGHFRSPFQSASGEPPASPFRGVGTSDRCWMLRASAIRSQILALRHCLVAGVRPRLKQRGLAAQNLPEMCRNSAVPVFLSNPDERTFVVESLLQFARSCLSHIFPAVPPGCGCAKILTEPTAGSGTSPGVHPREPPPPPPWYLELPSSASCHYNLFGRTPGRHRPIAGSVRIHFCLERVRFVFPAL